MGLPFSPHHLMRSMHTPASAGVPGPGEIRTPSRCGELLRFGKGYVVVPDDRCLGPELLKVSNKGVNEAVVVIHDQDFCCAHGCCTEPIVESVKVVNWETQGNRNSIIRITATATSTTDVRSGPTRGPEDCGISMRTPVTPFLGPGLLERQFPTAGRLRRAANCPGWSRQ